MESAVEQKREVKVSVIMPVYNAEEHLAECLDSVLGQSLKEIEVICVDDGSKDSSAQILAEYSEKDARVIAASQDNLGAGPARNHGMSLASGKYIVFMDSDDLYPAEYVLEKLVNAAETNNVRVCGGTRVVLKTDGESILSADPIGQLMKKYPEGGIVKYSELQYAFYYQCFMFERKLLVDNDITFPNYRRFQDPPLFVRAMVEAGEFYFIAEPSYVYREGSFQKIEWTEVKSVDMLKGVTDVLNLSKQYHLERMHQTMLSKLEKTYEDIMLSQIKKNNVKVYCLLVYANGIADFDLWDEATESHRYTRELTVIKKANAAMVKLMCSLYPDLTSKNIEEFVQRIRNTYSEIEGAQQIDIDNAILCILGLMFQPDQSSRTREQLYNYICSEQFEAMDLYAKTENARTQNSQTAYDLLQAVKPAFEYCNKVVTHHVVEKSRCLVDEELDFEPKVTVVIPVYNVEDYLAECLDSVINQTLKEIEILCIDDGSQDGSLDILLEYANKYKNIKVLQEKNSGLSAARNRCVEVAKGEYIHYLDSDDTIEPDTYEYLYNTAKSDNLDMVFFDGASFYETEELENLYTWYKKGYHSDGSCDKIYDGTDYFVNVVLNDEFRMSPCMYIVRRAFVEKNNLTFPEGILHEDNYYTVMCTLLSNRTTHVSEPFYNRRVREGSLTIQSLGFRHCYGYFACYMKVMDYVSKNLTEEPARSLALRKLHEILNNANGTYLKIEDQQEKLFYLALPDEQEFMFYELIVGQLTKVEKINTERLELDKKLKQTYAEKSEIRAKLMRTYDEKSEINAKLKKTYAEKSEINAKLKKTYEEKAERGIKIKALEKEKTERGIKIKALEKEKSERGITIKEQKETIDRVRADNRNKAAALKRLRSERKEHISKLGELANENEQLRAEIEELKKGQGIISKIKTHMHNN